MKEEMSATFDANALLFLPLRQNLWGEPAALCSGANALLILELRQSTPSPRHPSPPNLLPTHPHNLGTPT